MIRLENISKDFVVDGKTVHAVKDVTIEIDKGQIFGIIEFAQGVMSTLDLPKKKYNKKINARTKNIEEQKKRYRR